MYRTLLARCEYQGKGTQLLGPLGADKGKMRTDKGLFRFFWADSQRTAGANQSNRGRGSLGMTASGTGIRGGGLAAARGGLGKSGRTGCSGDSGDSGDSRYSDYCGDSGESG